MFAGAPLMLTQFAAQELRCKMLEGDRTILQGIRLNTQGTAAQFLKALGKAPPIDVLRLCNKTTGNFIGESLLQQADDLDFIQNVLSATGTYNDLNPLLNAL